jgi:hypothetical protein
MLTQVSTPGSVSQIASVNTALIQSCKTEDAVNQLNAISRAVTRGIDNAGTLGYISTVTSHPPRGRPQPCTLSEAAKNQLEADTEPLGGGRRHDRPSTLPNWRLL